VGGVGVGARGRPPEHEFVVAPVDEQRLVGVAGLVVLDAQLAGPERVFEKRRERFLVEQSAEVLLVDRLLVQPGHAVPLVPAVARVGAGVRAAGSVLARHRFSKSGSRPSSRAWIPSR